MIEDGGIGRIVRLAERHKCVLYGFSWPRRHDHASMIEVVIYCLPIKLYFRIPSAKRRAESGIRHPFLYFNVWNHLRTYREQKRLMQDTEGFGHDRLARISYHAHALNRLDPAGEYSDIGKSAKFYRKNREDLGAN